MDLESELEPFLSKIPGKDTSNENTKSMEAKSVNDKLRSENRNDMKTHKKQSAADEDQKGYDPSSRKRKRECCKKAVDWIRSVAKDPCNPDITPLPEKSKWKNHGNHLPWKQILLARDAMRLKKNLDKNQKMLPTMYDDDPLASERRRSSERLVTAKDPSRKKREQQATSPSDSEENEYVSDKPKPSPHWCFTRSKKKIPLGPLHQADLPEPSRENYENDPKWLGTQTWPLNRAEQSKSHLIERDPIGKGRQDSCGCQSLGSIECARFHVAERRKKMKLELGSGFHTWRMNLVGEEEVALSWTKRDELRFEEIVKSNRLSSEKYFWDELFRHFNKKGREALVSYYFNVFLLRRRALQNRSGGTVDIYSDDEESEYGPVADKFGANSPGSIFCSPKKSSYKNT